MSFNSIKQPGVEVTQTIRTPTPTIFNPTLVPLVCGPAKEIIKVFDDSGNINPKSLQGQYNQLPKIISQTSFPSPRGNISEVTVENDTIRTFLQFSNTMTELPRDPGQAFLTSYNHATKATIRSGVEPSMGWDLNPGAGAKTLSFVIDQPVRTLTSSDKAVTFTSTANATLTSQEVADQINAVWGFTIAKAVTLTGDARARVEISSPTYGAKSSVTIRAGASANSVLGFSSSEERVEGSGFRGQDQNDGTTQTPYIEFYRGNYFLSGTSTSFPGGGTGKQYGLIDEDGVFTNGKLAALVFTSNGIDLKAGDYMYADGVRVGNAEAMKVEESRIKLGTLNLALSTFNSSGKLIVAVRDQIKVNTMLDPTPFAPRYVWFEARNLTYPTSGNTSAVLTGSVAGAPATSASVTGTSTVTDFLISGLNLKITLTIDGVVGDEQVITFSGTFASISDITTFLNAQNSNIVATNSSGALKIATTRTGKLQGISINSSSTANGKLFFSTVSNTVGTGKDVEFVALPATLSSAANTFSMTISMSDVLTLQVSDDGFVTSTDITYTWPANAPYANMNALVTALNTNVAGTAPNDIIWSDGGSGVLVVKTVSYTGPLAGVRIKNNAGSNTALGSSKINFQLTDTASGIDGITGEVLKFTLDDRSKIYSTTFTTNSLVDAIVDINNIVGFPVASAISGTLDKLVLTSPLKGMASKIKIISNSQSTQANLAFGFTNTNVSAIGTGRPNPDFYLDIFGNVAIGGEILRNPVTGYPYDPASAGIYIQYRGLRKDVSPSAKHNPGLLQISDLSTLATVLGPITEENPLALAMQMQLLNAPNVICTGLGIDEISATEPEGTLAAYERAAEFIESHEIWAIAPLTHEDAVHEMFKEHCDTMSLPKNKSERVVLICPKFPDRANDVIIATGLSANSIVSVTNALTLDVNPVTALLTNGINPALPIPYSSQLYVKIKVGQNSLNYMVSSVNGVVLGLTTTFSGTQNLDGFFATTDLTQTIVSESWSLLIRGEPLLIAGSTLPDKQGIAEAVNEKGTTYLDKRVVYMFPDTVSAPINGVSKLIPGYFACAAYTGVKANERPQQGLTNFKIQGFDGVVNTTGFFNRSQLDLIAGGGIFILINDGAGLPIYARQQLTTDVRSLETQEFSIVSILDHTAKLIRTLIKQFIGTSTVNQATLDGISTVIDSIKKFLIDDLNSLVSVENIQIFQDAVRQDTIIINLDVKVPYPLNYINVTIFI